LILDAGTINCGVADIGAREITISQSLDAGVYWLAIQFTGSASDPSITYAGCNGYNLVGMSSDTSNDVGGYFANATTFPSTAGAFAYTGGGFTPFIWMRK
jgi:hypothetical protein